MVEKGFEALAAIDQSWESFTAEQSEENESSEKWVSSRATIGRAFSSLLQQAWLAPAHDLVSFYFLVNFPDKECIYIFFFCDKLFHI